MPEFLRPYAEKIRTPIRYSRIYAYDQFCCVCGHTQIIQCRSFCDRTQTLQFMEEILTVSVETCVFNAILVSIFAPFIKTAYDILRFSTDDKMKK